MNWAVMYDTTRPENTTLKVLVGATPPNRAATWKTDDEEWHRAKALLGGEPWFQKWVENVHADSDKQPFLVFTDRNGYFGKYQRAEFKWLHEQGFTTRRFGIAFWDVQIERDIDAIHAAFVQLDGLWRV